MVFVLFYHAQNADTLYVKNWNYLFLCIFGRHKKYTRISNACEKKKRKHTQCIYIFLLIFIFVPAVAVYGTVLFLLCSCKTCRHPYVRAAAASRTSNSSSSKCPSTGTLLLSSAPLTRSKALCRARSFAH